jgi:putative pyruvate formate lyase activating enzyme
MERQSTDNLINALSACTLCPLECGVDRTKKTGACGATDLKIAKYYLHPFEEPCISFKKGSGTIFFTGCNLQCVFCQNYDLSRNNRGLSITPNRLAEIFQELEEMGAENVSLVTPTHLIPYLVAAFSIYKPKIPVVYNSSGYEKVETLKQIDPFIDVYLPDLKFYSPALSKRYTGKENYFDYASKAIKFMSQKPLRKTEDGKMLSGLIVRHLVMPMGVADSKNILRWFKAELPETAHLSLMSQYTPYGDCARFPELTRPITSREYNAVLDEAFALGIENLFVQEQSSSSENFIPAWDY